VRPALSSIFDLGDPRYIAQVVPELYPRQPQPVLSNWPAEDREAFCGEYGQPCTCEYPYPVGIWDGHHPNCAAEAA
jgi:hypothetical protein